MPISWITMYNCNILYKIHKFITAWDVGLLYILNVLISSLWTLTLKHKSVYSWKGKLGNLINAFWPWAFQAYITCLFGKNLKLRHLKYLINQHLIPWQTCEFCRVCCNIIHDYAHMTVLKLDCAYTWLWPDMIVPPDLFVPQNELLCWDTIMPMENYKCAHKIIRQLYWWKHNHSKALLAKQS